VYPRLMYFDTQRALVHSTPGLFFLARGWTSAGILKHPAHMAFAFAAAKSDTQLELQLVERINAFADGSANVAVRYGLADANNHG
jgi:hypothetical protein